MKHSIYTSYDELPLMLSVAEVAAVDYEIDPVFAGAFENLRHALDRPVVVSNPEMHVCKDRKFYAFGIVPRCKRFRRNKTSGQQRRTPQEIASFNIHIAIANRKTPACQSQKYANFPIFLRLKKSAAPQAE